MKHSMLLLFGIPAISMVVIAARQIFDEMSDKKFTLERRASADQPPPAEQRRRFSDPTEPGTLRHPEAAATGNSKEVSAPQIQEA